MSGYFAWNLSMMAFSTSWDLPGWLVQKSNEPAGFTPLKSMSDAPLVAPPPLVDGPPQAASAAAPALAPASPRKFLRSRFMAIVGPLKRSFDSGGCCGGDGVEKVGFALSGAIR